MRALLVAAALLLAGCSAREGADASVLGQAADALAGGPSEEELARTPGAIEGVVTTESLAPIGGATVTLVRENATATTDAGGLFRFASLPTASYLVQARADGFATRTVAVAVRNGTVMEVNLTLARAASAEPYAETVEIAGFLSCGVRLAGPDGAEEGADCASADPNHADSFETRVGDRTRMVVVELSYDPEANPAARRLVLRAETVGYGHSDVELGSAVADGYARIVVPPAVADKYYPEGGALRVLVSMDASGGPAVALQTRFTVYVTAFYVEPGAGSFSVLGG